MKRKLSSLCIFLVAVFLITLLPAYTEQEHLPYVIESGYGSLQITSSPAGADVYADDIFASKTAPCTILLPVGKHDIRLVIPGYETCSETVMIEEGKEHVLESILLPELPESMTIIVNSEEDHPERSNDGIREQITVESLTGEITLRDALIAVQNDSSDTAYRIDFAENVNRIEFIKNEMYLVCGNLTINGDRNRDGVADVTLYASEGGLLFRPTANLRICGLVFQGESPLAFRPVDYGTEDVLFESIYVLGCEFQNPGLIAFGGACKTYNSRGSVDYSNIYFCGNKVDSGDVFFSYSGNTDNSIADGIYYCANKLSSDSCMTVITADCNTCYIYGRDTFEGNGGASGQFETSNDNIVRNVSISGNNGGYFVLGSGTNGNSHNILEDVIIRNNYFTNNLFIRSAQLFDESNIGNTLITSENSINRISITHNVLDATVHPDVDPYIYTSVIDSGDFDPSTTMIANSNKINSLEFIDNTIIRVGGDAVWFTAEWLIEGGIPYTLIDGIVPSVVNIIQATDEERIKGENNVVEGLVFSGNQKANYYDPYLP